MFKSWFIDFEPFGGKMPDDWKVGNLLDIADYLNGLAMQKFRPEVGDSGIPVLKIKELRQGFCDNNSERCSSNVKKDYIIYDGDVVFSWSGSLLVDLWCGGKCGLNQHLFKVTSKIFDKWFYYVWTKHHLDRFVAVAADKATTMGHIKRNELEKAEVIIPTSNDYKKIGEVLAPIYDMIIQNRIENIRLAQLRDTLLPKLMSGEIDVSKVNISADKLSFILLFIQSDQPELKVTSQEKSDPIITLVFIGVWDIPDQPEFLCFARNMARLASPHMNYRQEGPVGTFIPSKDRRPIPNRRLWSC